MWDFVAAFSDRVPSIAEEPTNKVIENMITFLGYGIEGEENGDVMIKTFSSTDMIPDIWDPKERESDE
jgi:hypothetical protein